MAKYAFVTCSAWFVALTAYCHVLDGEVEGQYVDQKEPLRIPACKPVRPEDVVDPMLDRNNQQYREYVRIGIDWTRYDGVLVNTWEAMEHTSVHALRNDVGALRSVLKAPVYPIGPLSRPFEPVGSKSDLIDWLDSQPSESVLYVSFGSGGTMAAEQMIELAWGLEMSGQRFVWVVRSPSGSATDASFFTAGSGSDAISNYLPDGFLTRTHKAGLVVPLWAPQVEILNHQSVGGFLSHCGLNSTYESIAGGVPMIAWPLYAEQRLNATMLTEELRVAVRPEVLPTKKVVGRQEIEKMVRDLMESEEGKAMRERVKKLKESAEEALRPGGSSCNSLCEVVQDCRLRVQNRTANARN